MQAILAVPLIALTLAACGEKDPVQGKADLLVGTWELAAAQEVGDEISFTYIFHQDGALRNRIGGAFLRQMREMDAVREALEGENLAEVELIDGGHLNWIGRWTLAGDSLTATYDRVVVEAFGDLPLVGQVAVPIFDQAVDPSNETTLGFTCRLQGDELVLRGESLTVGVDIDAAGGAVPPGLAGAAGEVVQLAVDFIGDQIRSQGLDTQTFGRQ